MHIPQILIVEDELVTRNALKNIFQAEGYQVLEATDGDEMHVITSYSIHYTKLYDPDSG